MKEKFGQQPENQKPNAPEPGAGQLGKSPPEQRPQDGGGQSPERNRRGPANLTKLRETFDGHLESEWRFSSEAFMRRTLEGMLALREKIQPGTTERLKPIYEGKVPEAYITESGKLAFNDIYQSVLRDGFDTREDKPEYERGLRDAFNLIITHLHGKREWEELQKLKKAESQLEDTIWKK